MNKQEKLAKRVTEILKLRGSTLWSIASKANTLQTLDVKIRDQIVDELAQELTEKGLDKDSEPNTYGLEIESLIDACNPKNG